jgi:hypothetical protein
MTTLPSGIGFNVDLNHFHNRDIKFIIKSLKKLKTKWIRFEIDYFKYKNKSNRKFLQAFLNECKKENIVVVGLLSQFVAGNIHSVFFPHHFHKPIHKYIEEYLHFVEQIVTEFSPYILHWEIWNEPNSKRFWITNPSPKEYVLLLEMMHTVIKKVSPKSKIIFGGIVGNDVTPLVAMPTSITQYQNFIEESLEYGASKYVDSYAFHPYVIDCYISFKSKEKMLDLVQQRILETREKYKKLSLVITEFGISPLLQLTLKEKDIAYIYTNLLQFVKELHIPIAFYTLIDLHPKLFSSLNPETQFGLLTNELKEKKLFTLLST